MEWHGPRRRYAAMLARGCECKFPKLLGGLPYYLSHIYRITWATPQEVPSPVSACPSRRKAPKPVVTFSTVPGVRRAWSPSGPASVHGADRRRATMASKRALLYLWSLSRYPMIAAHSNHTSHNSTVARARKAGSVPARTMRSRSINAIRPWCRWP